MSNPTSEAAGAFSVTVDKLPWAQIPEEMLFDPALSAEAVRVYGILLRHGHDGPEGCFPSYDRIGALMGKAGRSVPRYIRDLEAAGWVTRHQRRTAAGYPTSNGYTVHRQRAEVRGGDADRRADLRGTPAQDCAVPPRSSARLKRASEREPSNERSTRAAPADAVAAGQLPLGDVDPQGTSQPVDSPDPVDPVESLAWQLVRETYAARKHKPLESRKTMAKVVRRLLAEAGWTEPQVRAALLSSPVWTQSSLQVELTRGGATPAGRSRALADDPRRQGESRVVNIGEEMRRGR